MFRSVITLLIAITGVSSLQIAFFPRRTTAALPQGDLTGLTSSQASLREDLPGTRSGAWALSPSRHYSLGSVGDPQPSSVVTLFLTAVAARSAKSLQVALVTKGHQQLEMEDRRVYLTPSGDEYALGKIGGRDALQSCIVAGGGSGVASETLDRLRLQQPIGHRSLNASLHRLAGLETKKPTYCVLVTLISSKESGGNELLTIWRQIQRAHKTVIPPSAGLSTT